MNEHEFDQRLRSAYRARVEAAGPAPAALWGSVVAIPDEEPIRADVWSRRPMLILAAAAVLTALLAGTIAAIGSGLLPVPGPDESRVPGEWTTTGDLHEGFERDPAFTLDDGRVVLLCGDALACRVEIYDPSSGAWTKGDALGAPSYYSATLLSDGTILLAGGPAATRSSAAVLDPLSGDRSQVPMIEPRELNAAALLPDGRVLVTGGRSGFGEPTLASAEIFDPVTGTWTETTPMRFPREGHRAVPLLDGRILVVGGEGPGDAAPELYDPVSATWTATGPLQVPRFSPTVTRLADGRVLAMGLGPNHWSIQTELFDPTTGSWTPTGDMTEERVAFTATLLPTGQVLAAGGEPRRGIIPLLTAELYDPTSGTWSVAPAMPRGHSFHTAAALLDGRVLIIGGWNRNTRAVEIYEP
jgi:hypothetical protein